MAARSVRCSTHTRRRDESTPKSPRSFFINAAPSEGGISVARALRTLFTTHYSHFRFFFLRSFVRSLIAFIDCRSILITQFILRNATERWTDIVFISFHISIWAAAASSSMSMSTPHRGSHNFEIIAKFIYVARIPSPHIYRVLGMRRATQNALRRWNAI